VNFTDLSVGNVLVRIWDFGDGTGTLSAQNPSYTFDTAGTYSVALTVAGIGDSATVTKTDLIHVYDQPIASISADTTYGCVQGGVSFTVQFSTTTTGLNAAYQWDFGDGTVGSTARNPQHAYTSAVPDSFTVSLKVTTDCGEDSTAVTNMIYVDTLAPTAAFSMAPDSVGPGPLTVNFTDESQRARSWSWDFGDGSALSTEQNPQHIFGSAGTYTVQLTVRNGCGEIAKTHTVIVQ
jgi:PKD repeat protein